MITTAYCDSSTLEQPLARKSAAEPATVLLVLPSLACRSPHARATATAAVDNAPKVKARSEPTDHIKAQLDRAEADRQAFWDKVKAKKTAAEAHAQAVADKAKADAQAAANHAAAQQ